jgi:hypothetical protein
LTYTSLARRFIDDLNNIQPTIINASGKEAELERVETKSAVRNQNAFSFSLPEG